MHWYVSCSMLLLFQGQLVSLSDTGLEKSLWSQPRAVSITPIQDLDGPLCNSSSEESLAGFFQRDKTHKSIVLKKVSSCNYIIHYNLSIKLIMLYLLHVYAANCTIR